MRTPPSDFSGRGGRCGVHTAVPPLAANSARPSRSSLSSASMLAVTPSVIGCGVGRCITRFSRRGSEMSEISSRGSGVAGHSPISDLFGSLWP